MRLAILADTHMPRGSRRLPDRCLTELAQAELIIHLGDFHAASVLDELRAIGPPLVGVHGNVDDEAVRAALPARREAELEGWRIGLIHDAGPRRGRLERARQKFPHADAVLFGHSHMPADERSRGFRLFNPGSPTERRRAPHRCMGVGDVQPGRLRFEHVILE